MMIEASYEVGFRASVTDTGGFSSEQINDFVCALLRYDETIDLGNLVPLKYALSEHFKDDNEDHLIDMIDAVKMTKVEATYRNSYVTVTSDD